VFVLADRFLAFLCWILSLPLMERQWETAFVTPFHFTVKNEASILALSKELNDSLENSSQKSSVLQQVMSTLRYSRLTQAEMNKIVFPEVSEESVQVFVPECCYTVK
jgi:hypothetical protein